MENKKNQEIEYPNEELVDEADLEPIDITDSGGNNQDDDEFDLIMFRMQEIIISDEFEDLQEKFLNKYCDIFNDKDEHGHDQYTAFMDFKKTVQKYIEDELKEVLPDYSQKRFEELTKDRADQIDETIVETLIALDDFVKFKERMLEYKITKWSKQGRKDELLQDMTKQEYIDLVNNADIKGLEMAITVTNLTKN